MKILSSFLGVWSVVLLESFQTEDHREAGFVVGVARYSATLDANVGEKVLGFLRMQMESTLISIRFIFGTKTSRTMLILMVLPQVPMDVTSRF